MKNWGPNHPNYSGMAMGLDHQHFNSNDYRRFRPVSGWNSTVCSSMNLGRRPSPVCSDGRLALVDSSLQGDPLLMRRCTGLSGWNSLCGLVSVQASFGRCAATSASGQQRHWLREMVDLKQWLLADGPVSRRSVVWSEPSRRVARAESMALLCLMPFNGSVALVGARQMRR